MNPGQFLTEDVKNLMQRLSRTLQDVNGKSAENSDNSTMTFEPDHENLSISPRRHRERSSSPVIPEESLHRSPDHSFHQFGRTVSCERFQKVTLRRMQERARRTQQTREQVEKQREDKFREDNQHFRASERSKEMAGKLEPLSVRTAKIMEERQKKKQEVLAKLAQTREEKLKPDLTFKPKINPTKRDKMTPEDFYSYNMKWMQEAKKSLTAKEELRMRSANEAITLRPSIDSHSKKLVKQPKYAPKPEVRMSEFLKSRQKKVEDLRKTLEPSFTPEICAASKKMVRRAVGRPVEDRLYTPPPLHWKDMLVATIEPTPETQGSSPSTPRLSFGKCD